MNAKQAAEWKSDRQRRVAEIKERLMALPEPTAAEKQKLAQQSQWLLQNANQFINGRVFGGW